MPPLGLDEIQVAKAGECPADRFESQSDEICNIGPTEGKRELGKVLFARGKLVRKPEEKSTDAPFGVGARGEQERLLPLLHDAGNETVKLSANQLVLGDAAQQMPVRDHTKDRILKGDDCNGLCSRRGAEEANDIPSQSKRRNLEPSIVGARHGFGRTARNREEMREWSTLLVENLALLHSPSLDNHVGET